MPNSCLLCIASPFITTELEKTNCQQCQFLWNGIVRREATKPIVNLSVLLNIQVTWLYNGDAMVKLAIIMFGGTIANYKNAKQIF